MTHKLVLEDGAAARAPVLLVVHTNTFFVELFRLARILEASQDFQPLLAFYPYWQWERDVRRAHAEGISCFDLFGNPLRELADTCAAPVHRAASLHWLRKLATLIKLKAGLRWLGSFELLAQFRSLYGRIRAMRALLRELHPAAVVLGGDMVGYDTAAIIRASHDVGTPVVIVPSTMSNGLEQAEYYFDDPRHNLSSNLNRFVAWKYPRWAKDHRGRRLLREHGARIVAMEWLGIAPPVPWTFNSGYADVICIESEAMLEYVTAAGLRGAQLRITGSPSEDAMATALRDATRGRAALCSQLQLNTDGGILLCALPPDFLYSPGGRPQCEFREYRELVEFWIKSIDAVEGYNKVLCVHPSVNPEGLRYLETDDLRVASTPTAELIPLCDFFVASVSSTIRWAIACGKPVINYDVYRYRYTDYIGVPGVVTIEEASEFRRELRRISRNPARYEELAVVQRSEAPRWGMMDGRCGERILEALSDVIVISKGSTGP